MAGEVNERLPAVTQGLVKHFPLDETVRGIDTAPLINYSTWEAGQTGSVTGFSQNGSAAENSRVLGEDPWGRTTVLWQAIPVVNNSSDGGWNGTQFAVDNTKTYRFSVWVRRAVVGTGSFYLGSYAYGAVNGLKYTNAETVTTNPYFWSGDIADQEWRLVVAHVHPHTYSGGNHPDSGQYRLSGYFMGISRDYKWLPETTTALHRSYLYYSTDASTQQLWCYPRVDILDGTEPTLQELLQGEGNITKPKSSENIGVTSSGGQMEAATTNLLPEAVATGTVRFSANSSRTATAVSSERAYVGTTSMKTTQVTAGTNAGWYTADYAITPGALPYAGSCYVYSATATELQLSVWFKTPAGYVSNSTKYVNAPANAWVRIESVVTAAPADATHISLEGRGTQTVAVGTVAYWDAFQIEQKPYCTSFTPTTRAAASLVIPSSIGTSDFTIIGTMTPSADSDTLADGQHFMSLGSGFILQTYQARPYIDGNTITGVPGSNVHQDYNTLAGVDVTYVLKRQGTAFSWRMLGADGQDVTWTKVDTSVPAKLITEVALSGNWGGTHRNLSIYKRALTDAEIKKVITPAFSITKTGNVRMTIQESDALTGTVHMRSQKDGTLQVKGQLKEGQVL